MEICNIKCSVKILLTSSLKVLKEKCIENRRWLCNDFGSYIVIKPNHTIRFIIFKPKTILNKNHINVTGVRSYSALDFAIDLLCDFLECEKSEIELKIDNISAKSD